LQNTRNFATAFSFSIPAGCAAGLAHIGSAVKVGLFTFKEEDIDRRSKVFVIVLLLHLSCGALWARSITVHQAEKAVSGWLRADVRPLQTNLGQRPRGVQTFADQAGEPIYYVVHLEPCGFVIVSADDDVEPIIAFSDGGNYDPSVENPLGALVTGDMNARMAAVRARRSQRTRPERPQTSGPREKWNKLMDLADASEGGFSTMSLATTPADVRVEPLLQTQWGQQDVCGNLCYNFFTPGSYRTGCVATAMAQLMRYHQYPTDPIGQQPFTIRKDNSKEYWKYTYGSDGKGAAYKWNRTPLAPDCPTTEYERSMIGVLCYDAAISVNTHFTNSSSQADTLKSKDALVETFGFANAVKAYNSGADIGGDALIEMINPNLDAKAPVILGLTGSSGHAVICDGYGYNSSTLYHHLNMGWEDLYDAWYNLPNVDSNPAYSSVYKCVYNIRTTGVGGEYVSGRVCDFKGRPIPNPTVYAQTISQGPLIYAESDAKGIYAFDNLDSATTYSINVSAGEYTFASRNITTGISHDNSAASGNLWGVDFYSQYEFGSLIGQWKLDETSGNLAHDSAGISDGTLYGGPQWQPSGGMFDGALFFDGNDDHVRIPNEWNFDLTEAITVSTWIKIDIVDDNWQAVVAKGDSAWRLSTLRDTRKFHFAVTGPPDNVALDGTVRVPLSEWHHVCGTYDKINLRLYIDGVEDPGGPVPYGGAITTNNYDVYIGENAQKTGRHWNGLIDEVRIYNYALRRGEVARLLCYEQAEGDLNYDCMVDMADYAAITSAWLSKPGDTHWNPQCDISLPPDNTINMLDLNRFLDTWLAGAK